MNGSTRSGRSYGGKTREQRLAERHEKLLDAGLELFGTVGYAATTIPMLCAAAGLNPRYFYEAFGTREALLLAVYDRDVARVLASVVTALDGAPADVSVRMEIGLRTFVTGVLADERAARINYFEMVGVSPQLDARRRAVLRLYADFITAQIEQFAPDRPVPGGDRRLAAVAFVGAVDGLIVDALSGGERVNIDRIVATLLETFLPAER